EVRPEHDEREHQVAEIVKVSGGDNPIERRTPTQPDEDRDQEGECRQTLPANDQYAVNCREPMWLERHQPVERGERYGQPVGEEATAAEHLHAAGEAWVARPVLLQRPGIEQI